MSVDHAADACDRAPESHLRRPIYHACLRSYLPGLRSLACEHDRRSRLKHRSCWPAIVTVQLLRNPHRIDSSANLATSAYICPRYQYTPVAYAAVRPGCALTL